MNLKEYSDKLQNQPDKLQKKAPSTDGASQYLLFPDL